MSDLANDARLNHRWPSELAAKIRRAALERKLTTDPDWTVTDEVNDRLRASFARLRAGTRKVKS